MYYIALVYGGDILKNTSFFSFAITHPDLAGEWHPSKNGNLTAYDVTYGSNKIVWWICKLGHEWDSTIKSRSRSYPCPYCSGRLLNNQNSLLLKLPGVSKEWHPTKNGSLNPAQIKYNSSRICWWKCEMGHEWETSVSSRNRGKNCPYCANKKVSKENNFGAKYKHLIQEWHPTKNSHLTPFDYTYGSGKRVWWRCNFGHEYEMVIRNKGRGNGCPFCSNKKINDDNSLMTTNPTLSLEWDYETNQSLTPNDVSKGSSRIVWWICSKGHKWKASIASRNSGACCPYCSNKKTNEDNCLATTHPQLLKEWHPFKNISIDPYSVTYGSTKKVWWICERGHDYETSIYSKSRKNVGCTVCNKQTSFPEQAIYYYLKTIFKDAQNVFDFKINKKRVEADIYIPSLSTVIEYDGEYYHRKRKSNDLEKNKDFISIGLDVIRIREKGLEIFQGIYCLLHDSSKRDNLNTIILSILEYLLSKHEFDKIMIDNIGKLKIETEKDANTIMNNYMKNLKEKSFIHTAPELLKEWDYEKNEGINPEMFSHGSDQKVGWICEKGHRWYVSISKRTIEGTNCPYCSNQKVNSENCLRTLNPSLAAEWHPTKNRGLFPINVVPNSTKNVWWICSKGHEWKSTVHNRSYGNGCPFCAGRKVCSDNNLLTLNPNLSQEWNNLRNKNLTPSDVTLNSNKKVWWLCKNKHEWEALIISRNRGNGCPFCSGRLVTDKNSLAIIDPNLAMQWHPTKNKNFTPNQITISSGKKVWWRCEIGHEWEASPNNRNKTKKCPFCSGARVTKETSFAFLHKELLMEWNFEKNNNTDPESLKPYSHKIVWWKCEMGHEWETNIRSRTEGSRCPFCRKIRHNKKT